MENLLLMHMQKALVCCFRPANIHSSLDAGTGNKVYTNHLALQNVLWKRNLWALSVVDFFVTNLTISKRAANDLT